MRDNSMPQDPLRSLVDTSLEDYDENDESDDDVGDNEVDANDSNNIVRRLYCSDNTSTPTSSDDHHHNHHAYAVAPQQWNAITMADENHLMEQQHQIQLQRHQYIDTLQLRQQLPKPIITLPFSTTSSNQSRNAAPITPLHYIPYVHGGYAAAAPLFVSHSKFAYILKKLLPGAYEELSMLLRNNCEKIANGVAAGGKLGQKHVVVASSGGGGRSEHCGQGSTDNTINDSSNNTNIMNQTENRTSGRSSSPNVLTSSSNSNSLVLSDVKGGKNDIRASPGPAAATATAETAEIVLADPVKIMKWAENNPVVSAFGIWTSDSGRRTFTFMKGRMNPSTIRKVSSDDDIEDATDIQYENVEHEDKHFYQPRIAYNNPLQQQHGRRHPPSHIQRPKRRKQPLPEDLPSSSSIESSSRIYHNLSPMVVEEPGERPPCYNKPALEWDVFLDPNLVRQVDAAMSVVERLEIKLRKATLRRERRLAAAAAAAAATNKGNTNHNAHPYCKSVSTSSNAHHPYCQSTSVSSYTDNSKVNADGGGNVAGTENDDEDINDDDFDVLQSHTAAQVEVDRLVSQLMRRTVLAHGSMSQLVLEAMGVAPKYNFGTVVKSSRDVTGNGTATGQTPSRRSRRHDSLLRGVRGSEGSLDMTKTWDETEEQYDFEALLDPSIITNRDGKSSYKGSKRKAGSQGMFMETWIHAFARTLSLLAKSSKNSGGDDVIARANSSNSTRSIEEMQQLLVENKPPVEQGFSGLIEKIFLRRESSVADPSTMCMHRLSVDDRQVDPNNFDDDDSDLLTNHDMLSPTAPTSTSMFGNLCGMSLCLGMGSDDSKGGASSTFPLNPHLSHKMAQDIEHISAVLGEPLRLVLDLKSRRVPPRVWSRLIDSLRTQGLVIEGIGSFDVDELRVIGKGCSYPLTPILFFHSVGDLQRACHANEVKDGDHVYFNGGSLMWKRTSIMEAAERGCCGAIQSDQHGSTSSIKSPTAAGGGGGGNYSFQPYAFPRSALSDWERVMCKSTIEDYRRHFNLRIGVYVQEFSISAEALDALAIHINKYGEVYDQGLAFGGVNGSAVKNINGDGYWNQRYMGRPWDFTARPSNEMTPLKPEDHHLVQKAIQAGAWGQVGTIYEVMDDEAGALTAPREPCDVINMVNSSF